MAEGRPVEFTISPGSEHGWVTENAFGTQHILEHMVRYTPEHFRIKAEVKAPATYEAVKAATPEQLHELPEWKYVLALAYRAGGQIQYRLGDRPWTDCHQFGSFAADTRCQYRVKPADQYRAWTSLEVPVGALVKPSLRGYPTVILEVSDTDYFLKDSHITGMWDGKIKEIDLSQLFSGWLHSTDNGKTWTTCGVKQ